MTAKQKKALEASLLAALLPLFLKSKGIAYAEIGREDTPKVTARQKTALARFIKERVGKIDTGITQRLEAARVNLPPGVTLKQSLAQAQTEIRAYNDATLSPFLGGWAGQQGYVAGYTEEDPVTGLTPADTVVWDWTRYGDNPPDDECQEANDASPASLNELLAITGSIPPIHPNCFVAGTLVAGALTHAAFKRPYQGPIITIRTTLGNELSGTPNHPILTPEGWVALGSLKEGQRVMRCLDLERVPRMLAGGMGLRDPNEYQIPALIEEVLSAKSMPLFQVPVAATDFHGDGIPHSEVNIVFSNRRLDADRDPLVPCDRFDPAGQEELVGAGVASLAFDAAGAPKSVSRGIGPTACSVMRRTGIGRSLFCGHFSGAKNLRGTPPPWYNVALNQSSAKRLSTDARLLAERLLRFSGLIAEDQIIEIRDCNTKCHVYNLSTSEGWYVANNIIVSNCSCDLVALA